MKVEKALDFINLISRGIFILGVIVLFASILLLMILTPMVDMTGKENIEDEDDAFKANIIKTSEENLIVYSTLTADPGLKDNIDVEIKYFAKDYNNMIVDSGKETITFEKEKSIKWNEEIEDNNIEKVIVSYNYETNMLSPILQIILPQILFLIIIGLVIVITLNGVKIKLF